jgi:hypothetical protein
MKRFGACILSVLLCLGLAGTAFAHAHLTGAVPAENAVSTATPTSLQLKFSEGLELKFSGVRVIGPAGTEISMGSASLAPGDDTTLIVPIVGRIAAGTYTVMWHTLAADGHATHGTYTFTVKT